MARDKITYLDVEVAGRIVKRNMGRLLRIVEKHASRLAVETIKDHYNSILKWIDGDGDKDGFETFFDSTKSVLLKEMADMLEMTAVVRSVEKYISLVGIDLLKPVSEHETYGNR